MITWSDVIAFAPQLTSLSTTAHAVIVAFANASFSPDLFGGEGSPTLRMARLCMAAHLASTFPAKDAGTGAVDALVASESVGGVSRSYTYTTSASVTGDASLQSSSFGRMIVTILQSSPARVGFAF